MAKRDQLDLGIDPEEPKATAQTRRGNDRTILSHLGFADPDKGDARHDAACRYVVENAEKIARRCLGSAGDGWKMNKMKARQEFVLGDRFVVGFIDVSIKWQAIFISDDGRSYADDVVTVEVKIAKVPLGDALRQLKLYDAKQDRDYVRSLDTPHLVLVTAYALTEREVQTLTEEGIVHLRLGDAFEAWFADTKPAVSEEL